MYFDIVEALRQKQRQHAQVVSTESGDEIDITMRDGKVVIRREAPARLIFEPLEARHASELCEILRDPELYAFLDETPPPTEHHLQERFAGLESRKSPDGKQQWLNWAIRETSAGSAIGYVQATVEGGEAHIGYVVARHCWGKGLGTEAVAWLVHCLASLDIAQIVATVEERNLGSIRILTKLGFEPSGKRGTEITMTWLPQGVSS